MNLPRKVKKQRARKSQGTRKKKERKPRSQAKLMKKTSKRLLWTCRRWTPS